MTAPAPAHETAAVQAASDRASLDALLDTLTRHQVEQITAICRALGAINREASA